MLAICGADPGPARPLDPLPPLEPANPGPPPPRPALRDSHREKERSPMLRNPRLAVRDSTATSHARRGVNLPPTQTATVGSHASMSSSPGFHVCVTPLGRSDGCARRRGLARSYRNPAAQSPTRGPRATIARTPIADKSSSRTCSGSRLTTSAHAVIARGGLEVSQPAFGSEHDQPMRAADREHRELDDPIEARGVDAGVQ